MAATEVKVPDIGDFDDVQIIEIHVKTGDQINAEDPVVTLESDKATMDVPAPLAGVVRDVQVKVGDRVSEGALLLVVDPGDGAVAQPPSLVEQQEPVETVTSPPARREASETVVERAAEVDFAGVHAGPSVRRTARELGVELSAVKGTGPKGRITKD